MTAEPLTPTPDVVALQRAVIGRYALERELGRGGMGLVLLARDVALDRPVAIKLLPGALAADPALRARFLREARIAAGLSHPHVVPLYAVEEHPDAVFFAMAYVDGETLAGRVRRAGPLPPGEVARVLREVAWALAYAHGRGVVHRDVKPENVMVERGSGRALVADFGIARVVDGRAGGTGATLTRDGEILGSVAFMSPEQAEGAPVDGRSDLYALGGVGYYALAGRPPFEAPSAAALLVKRLTGAAPPVAAARPDVPPRLAAVVDRCLARAPEQRFDSAEAVADALATSGGATPEADLAPPVRSFVRAAEQTMWLVSLIAVFTLLYGLPATRNLVVLLFAIAFGVVAVSADLLRRARDLLGEGYGAPDVRRAFELERGAHEAELRALFDARRTAAARRTRRRAWGALGAALGLKAVTIWRFLHPPRAGGAWVAATVAADVATAVSLVIALNASPRAERRFFRVTARLWESRFGSAFFRVAGLGRARGTAGGNAPGAAAVAPDLLPAGVAARFPDLSALLRRLEREYAALGAREADVARAVAAAGVNGAGPPDDAADPTPLHVRRAALIADLQGALDATRARRTALAAARENVRVQLLRIGAGVGTPEDLADDVGAARVLVGSNGTVKSS